MQTLLFTGLILFSGRFSRFSSGAMRLSKIITLFSVIVYAVALTQKGFHTGGELPGAWSPGLYLLFIGPLGVLYGVFEWLGNPILFAAWIFSLAGKNKIALPLAFLATALIAAFLFRHTIIASKRRRTQTSPATLPVIGFGYRARRSQCSARRSE